jgi:epidermal growth factor receptor substrate 15
LLSRLFHRLRRRWYVRLAHLRSDFNFLLIFHSTAYLTNPSENSFRAYLTEQSFRHHLSRLDENLDDEQSDHTACYSNIYSGPSPRSSSMHGSEQNTAPFHFANRASISLRTPKHVFHSFAIFTIAAMVPVAKASQSDDKSTWSISDSWYIGAFGKWWRGGVWETWYQDVIARAKDEESWSSGILNIKNLDMLPDFHGS